MSANELGDFIEKVCGDTHLRVESDLGDGFVRLRSSEAERRQAAQDIRCSEDIVIELLRNSRDAHAKHIFVAVSREGDARTIVVVDDGDGIPLSMHAKIFEPRVTSKLDTAHMDKWGMHGRGMAMYSVAVNAELATVRFSKPSLGTSILVKTNLTRLGERSDQSTFPRFCGSDGETFSMRGPKNIIRICCEFALEHRKECEVYCASPAEIAAALYRLGCSMMTAAQRCFASNVDEISTCKRLALAASPEEFARVSCELGLQISSRTARRIMDGQEKAPLSLLERMRRESFETPQASHASEDSSTSSSQVVSELSPIAINSCSSSPNDACVVDARGLRIAEADRRMLVDSVRASLADVADRYYLEPGEPSLRVSGNAFHITIPFEKLQ